ncbi:MAG: hypothetical protein AB4058_11530 [Microcystaceae cyanobacterium]
MNHTLRKNTLTFILICLIISLFIFGQLSKGMAADPQRVLRSEIRNLENRVRRLEAEVRRINGRTNTSPRPNINSDSSLSDTRIVDGELVGRSDPLMERFATLIIELKEDVRTLDQRLSQLENKD